MGVTGLWRLLEGSEHTLTESDLVGLKIAVDIGVWIAAAQADDALAAQHANPHLFECFHRATYLLRCGASLICCVESTPDRVKAVKEWRTQRRKAKAQSPLAPTHGWAERDSLVRRPAPTPDCPPCSSRRDRPLPYVRTPRANTPHLAYRPPHPAAGR
jgi:hypothetical protein